MVNDYIGAPWLMHADKNIGFFKGIKWAARSKRAIKKNKINRHTNLPDDIQFYNKVGNGGFSLRHVEKFYHLCQTQRAMIDFYNANSTHYAYNEDVFWSIEVNRKKKHLRIPNYRIAARFSIEHGILKAFELNHGRLPFGCHAWDLFLDYWQPVFKYYGYDVEVPQA